jgi:Flp pilus assembly pilin Flp
MRQLKNKRGQSIFEVALVIAVVCAALIAMAPAIGRRIKGYVQSNASSISQQSWGASAEMRVVGRSNSSSFSDSGTSTSNSDSFMNQVFNVGAYEGGDTGGGTDASEE